MYVANLPKTFYNLDFTKFFKNQGYQIAFGSVSIDKVTEKPTQYGFLTFYTQEEAERCQREMNNFEIKGQPIRTSLVVDKKSGFDQKANVIVKNLH